ncbi:sarcosine oxidase subunit gamma family protein [Pseudonocardia sp.]|jgi:sarcosine oxidase subunit gamma|uniref:sarcosine oxidase subunit gamma n=1 Tax=Pseudonocardia sp. TaxID=60912 RepID=UPI0031FC4EC4
MAETGMGALVRTGPLHGWAGRFAELPDTVALLAEPFHSMVDVRCSGAAVERVAAHIGTTLPVRGWAAGPAEVSGCTAIWLGPDEWLVTSPFVSPADLEAGLREALDGEGAAVDVSAQRTTIRLRGAHVRDVLETGCAIDLHLRAFPARSAAVTTLGRAGVVLLALDDEGTDYRILVRSSFAGYLAEWLIDAATEWHIEPGTG